MVKHTYFAIFFAAFVFVTGLLASPSLALAGYFDYSDVLLVINDNSATSTTIGNYFAAARGIASTSIIHLNTVTSEGVTRTEFTNNIRTPIENFITSRGIATTTNYIVTTKGVPLMLNDTGCSVESELGLILGPYSANIGVSAMASNPYYNANVRFSRATYGVYIVTRLDGYTITGIESMIDRSANGTTTNVGTVLLDVQPSYDGAAGYKPFNDYMRAATTSLLARGYSVLLDQTTTYLTYRSNLLGYISWGSNDGQATTTNSIPHNTYVNGAIGDTGVSTSARSFAQGTTYGQSLIADWLAEGISGMKGYVSEPYVSALSHADILFDRYTSGFTMADSFFAAAGLFNWKDEFIGDPKMIIVKNVLPFTISSPATNAISGTQTPTFSWVTSESYYGITKYQLFVDGVLNKDNITGTSTTPSGNITAGVHTWYVKAFDGAGNSLNSTATFSINIIPGYAAGYTFYVDNVLGNDNNPGTQALPWATLVKAGATVQAGDTVVIIKNVGVPYRESLMPSTNGTATGTITFRGVDLDHKPEVWGSADISSGWSVYGGGNPDTYQYATTTNVQVFAAGPSMSVLSKKTHGASATTLNPGEWFWVSNVLYYRLAAGEAMGSLHVEASMRYSVLQSTAYTTFQDIVARYGNTYGVFLSNSGVVMRRVEEYESPTGIFAGGASTTLDHVVAARNKSYGLYLNFVINANVIGSTIYGNAPGGVRIVTLANTSATLRNNIISGNGGPSVSFNVLINPSAITASNNLWDIAGDSTWSTWKGVNNQEVVDPLLVDPTATSLALGALSPAVDTGTTTIGITTDILGNPIYGTPDIGGYEYQPPYTIGTNNIDITGNVRLYGNGKYRYTSATSSGTQAILNIAPVGGFPSADYREFMNIAISRWNTSGDYGKTWTESSTIATSTVHTIGNLSPDELYDVSVDGGLLERLRADGAGSIQFTYGGGYSTHTFDISKYNAGGTSYIYGCTNISATNYNASANADDGSCTYTLSSGGGSVAVPLVTATTVSTESSSIPSLPVVNTIHSVTSSFVTPVNISRTLTLGMSGSDVAQLQTFLAQDKVIYPEGIISGYFGKATERAVGRFQEKYNIVASGTPSTTGYGAVGPKTRTFMSSKEVSRPSILQLVSATSSLQTSTTTSYHLTLSRTLSLGMSGADVTQLQTFLAQDRDIYPEGIISGYFGHFTELAVQRFQQKNNIVREGTAMTTGYGAVGPKTRRIMME